ncbi:MAG TPA: hypothetical protein VFQ21_06350 [Gemmatimonadota bacterium]|nr:hypothetical protein [Gemmatimonadota bacterium]
MTRSRPVVSSGLIAVGGILLFAGLIAFWGRVAIYDPHGFSSRAIEVLENDAVRTVVTENVVDEIVARGSAQLVAVRPVLELAVGQVVESRPFRAIYGNAVRQAHASLFAPDQAIVLELLDLMIIVDGAVRAIDPQLAERLPDVRATLIQLRKRDFAAQAIATGTRVRFLGWLLPLLAFLAFGAGVWLASDRDRAVSRVGVSAAAAGAAVTATVGIGRAILMSSDLEPLAERALLGIWRPFAGDLAIWGLGTAVLGIALAAAAASAFRPVDIRADADRVRRALTTVPESRLGRLARALGIVLAAVAMIRWPSTLMGGLGIAAGLYALYVGLNELIRASGIGIEGEVPRGAQSSGRAAGLRALRHALTAAILVLGLVGAGWLYVSSRSATAPGDPGGIRRCNGHAELCDRPLTDVVLATGHNAMAAAAEPGWFFASQDGGLRRQLEFGMRGFMIDTYYGFAVSRGVRTSPLHERSRQTLIEEFGVEFTEAADRLAARLGPVEEGARPEVFMCHVMCEVGATRLADALTDVREFLESNHDEVVVIILEDGTRPEDTVEAFREAALDELAFVKRPSEPWPTLAEMIDANRPLLVMTESGATGPPWLHSGWELMQETPYAFRTPADFNCAESRGRPDSPLFILNHWIHKVTPSPADADSVNAYDVLLRRALECQMERGRIPNFVAVNFYDRGNVLAVVDALNGIPASSPESLP